MIQSETIYYLSNTINNNLNADEENISWKMLNIANLADFTINLKLIKLKLLLKAKAYLTLSAH